MHNAYHSIIHWLSETLGQLLTDQTPSWLHPLLHIVLFWGPLLLALVLLFSFFRTVWNHRLNKAAFHPSISRVSDFPGSVLRYIYAYTKKDQWLLAGLGLMAMPILYFTLELPKIIINEAISSQHFPHERFGFVFEQEAFLITTSLLFLFAILANGSLKYLINIYKGRVGERLLRRLRLQIYKNNSRTAVSTQQAELIPVLVQEVEPIGGFAAEAFSLPVFQGGTFLTILVFMFMQDPVLGAAALLLLPVQILLIPKLQKRINQLARRRVVEIRMLSNTLNDTILPPSHENRKVKSIGKHFRKVENLRLKIHRTKFLMKALNNFLTALTPFFFYAIGGFLVIEGSLSLGSLIAALTAYKDLSAPIRELFRFYQSFEDVRIRYRGIMGFLGSTT